jgi:acyl-ACP thioesterase
LFRQDGHLTIEPKKLQVSKGLLKLTDFQVRTTDLDMNGHVNNTRFAQWVLDSLPLEAHEAHQLRSYEINFLAEARYRDRISIQAPVGRADHFFQGHRYGDDKLLFVAKLGGEKS